MELLPLPLSNKHDLNIAAVSLLLQIFQLSIDKE